MLKYAGSLISFRIEFCAQPGCSAVWLARFVRDEEVVGSNPATPILALEIQGVSN